jgi:predicted GNAT family acetyltransferase
MDITVRNNTEAGTYDAVVDDKIVGRVLYGRAGDRVILRSTVVDEHHRNQGIATKLVHTVLDDIAASGLSLTNYCGFINGVIATNPNYGALVDQEHPGRAPRA